MTVQVPAGRGTELLEAAVLEFLENGYSAVGVREITTRAGVSHGTFYNYFESKRQMLSVLIEREFSVVLRAVDEASARAVDEFTEDSLRAFMVELSERVLTIIADRLDVFGFLLMQAPGVDAGALDEFIGFYRETGRRADVIFARARAAGVVDSDLDHEYISQAWVSFVLGVVAGMITGVDEFTPDRAAVILTNLLLDGAPLRG